MVFLSELTFLCAFEWLHTAITFNELCISCVLRASLRIDHPSSGWHYLYIFHISLLGPTNTIFDHNKFDFAFFRISAKTWH